MGNVHIGNVGKTSIPRNKFNLSHRVLGNTSAGLLMPIQADMMIPSDIFKIRQDIIIRMMPLTAPILQPIEAKTYTFFVPIRLVDDQFEQSISGGERGENTSPDNTVLFPKWDYPKEYIDFYGQPTMQINGHLTLANAFGFRFPYSQYQSGLYGKKCLPVEWLRSAYNLIWNEYFRDEWLQNEINIHTIPPMSEFGIMRKNWKKDYFTSALSETQKGTAPSLPITGESTMEIDPASMAASFNNMYAPYNGSGINPIISSGPYSSYPGLQVAPNTPADPLNNTWNPVAKAFFQDNLNKLFINNTVNMSNAGTFDVNDIRAVIQIQKWLERNARVGTRYTELLRSRFNVQPQDFRLQRPEFIGSTTQPIIISEVLQTGQPTQQSNLAQGNMAGHGISADRSDLISYKAQEHGILLTLFCITPKRAYSQGNERQWTMNDMYDMPFPEFTHLGEREIYEYELFMSNNAPNNEQIFGFRGIYDEYRSHYDKIVGEMGEQNGLGYWSMLEKFANAPQLNSDFIQMKGDFLNSVFAIRNTPGGIPARNYIYNIGNHITAYRPLPQIAEPGLIDHF